MTNRSKRILWLLQHKTLLQSEVPLLRRLGFEVFVPKVLPEGVRSASTTFEHDASLTIPRSVLDALNQIDFYRDELDDETAETLNRYFGAAMTIVFRNLHRTVLRRFRGAVVLRAFGTPAPDTYLRQLLSWDPDSVALVHAAQDRFWFGAGYPQLAAAEPPLLADRNTYLPIALPDGFVRSNAGTWRGDTRQILLLCPDIRTHPTNGALYREFTESYGDLPYVIVGGQTLPVDDPHVIGFVSDDELLELMQASSVMVYPTREPRHVQFHPIEASVIGLPVVFRRDSLLGSLLEPPPVGAVANADQERALVLRLLDGEQDAIDAVRSGERAIVERFSEKWCEGVWSAQLAESGIAATMGAPPAPDLSGFDPAAPEHLVPSKELVLPGHPVDPTPLSAGADFREVNLPSAFTSSYGLAFADSWGRAAADRRVRLRLSEPVSGAMELELTGGAPGPNQLVPIRVELGGAESEIRLPNWIEVPSTVRIGLRIASSADLLTITAPKVVVDVSGRPVSFSLAAMRLRRRPPLPIRAARRGLRTALGSARRLLGALSRS